MNVTRCPKCGSDQILNDECLKCGVIVSKVLRSAPTDPQKSGSIPSVSFVSPPAAPQVSAAQPQSQQPLRPSLQIPPLSRATKKSNAKMNLVLTAVLLVLIAGAHQTYRYFVRKAAVYSGYYWNSVQRFSLNFPVEGWSHYQSEQMRTLQFKDANDAFYRGDDPDEPDVVMMVWAEGTQGPIPERFDQETSDKIQQTIEDEITRRMTQANLRCQITDSKMIRIDGNDGLEIHADLQKDQLRMKTIIYCAFNERSAYTIQFLGKEKPLLDSEAEIAQMMTSFAYTKTIF